MKPAKLIYIILLIALLIVSYRYLPIDQWVGVLKDNAESLGYSGWIIYIVIYAIATLILAPASVLTLAAGFIYGLQGFFIVIFGAIIGASLSFLAGRYVLQNKVKKYISNKPKLNAIDKAVEEEGWKIVALCRLSPLIPFNLQNWFFGITSVSFKSYFLSSFFGIMPGTLLYVWIGSFGGDIAANEDTSLVKTALLVIGLIATFIVTWYISKKAKAKLNELS